MDFAGVAADTEPDEIFTQMITIRTAVTFAFGFNSPATGEYS